ncbi:TonB-dependent siderophore receptor [Asticcacaulis sp.]|uniref:TonB-dependent receptor plug domain-containing protein n=1 Tax=Asticcacaulis sp. TaxID=1872648 RepID=UPI00260416DD|nr:TonB-dependent receptor [Asticcacaulis sp.]
MIKKIALAALTTVSLAAFTQMTAAQSLDYTQYEAMFGEPVTTSALGIPQRASVAPTTMTILTQDDIRRSGVRDLIELMARVEGVDIQRASIMDGDVGVRGYNQTGSNRLLVMVNGRQVYVDHQGYVVWAALPITLPEIRQIEIVRGPNTALFGFNAVSGVINIITYNPLMDNINTADITVGTQGRKELSAVKSVKFGDWGGLRLSTNLVEANGFKAERRDANDLRQYSRRGFDYGKPFREYFGADGLFQVAPGFQAGVELTHTRAETYMRVSSFNVTTPQGTRAIITGTPYWSIQSGKVYFAADSDFGSTKGQFYITRNGSWGGPRDAYRVNDNIVGQVEHLFKLDAENSFRISLEARSTDYDTENRNGATALEFEAGYYLYASSVSWMWQITDSLSLATAARLDVLRTNRKDGFSRNMPWTKDDYSQTNNVFGYNAALSYTLDEDTNLRFSNARGIQYPNLINIFNNNGNPYLKPAVVRSYELSVNRNLPFIDATASANLFYTKTDNLIRTVGSGVGGRKVGLDGRNYSITAPIGDSQVKGVELALKGKIDTTWRWGLNYTWLDTHDFLNINKSVNPVTGTGYTTNIDYKNTNIPSMGNASIGFTAGKWEGDLYLNAVAATKQFDPPTGNRISRSPSYMGLSGRIAYAVASNVTLAVSGSNFNRDQILIGEPRPIDRQVFGTVTINW